MVHLSYDIYICICAPLPPFQLSLLTISFAEVVPLLYCVVCVCVGACGCVFVCGCGEGGGEGGKERERDRETDRQTDRRTDRQSGREGVGYE